jgi:hypothetical protein
MKLPQGITGFRKHDDPPLPTTDFPRFKSDCYTIAMSLNGRIDSFTPPQGVANFGYAVITLQNRTIAVLLNAHHPIIAFAQPFAEVDHQIQFLDAPDLAENFRAIGAYIVTDCITLASELTSEASSTLSAAELGEVKYWRPRCIGELVFNYWD